MPGSLAPSHSKRQRRHAPAAPGATRLVLLASVRWPPPCWYRDSTATHGAHGVARGLLHMPATHAAVVARREQPAKRRRGGARKEETHRQAQAGSASASPGATPVRGSFLDEEKHKLINRIFE